MLAALIIDFGIARFLDHSSITDSSAGHGPCTPAYAAREQLTNRKVDIDSRTDYFALGVIASELICGEHPFSPEANENDDDIVENIISGTYRIRDKRNVLSAAFREFLEKSLQPEPFQRFRTSLEAMKLLIGN